MTHDPAENSVATLAATPSKKDAQIWCGREGWLSVAEFIRRNERDIEAYLRSNRLIARAVRRTLGSFGHNWWGFRKGRPL